MNPSPWDADLINRLHPRLRAIAARLLQTHTSAQSRQATELVHEAWFAMKDAKAEWESEEKFVAYFLEVMRNCIRTWAKQRNAAKRGRGEKPVPLSELEIAADERADFELALEDAMEKFQAYDPIGAELMRLRHYLGLINRDAARHLGITEKQAEKKAAFARAWLRRQVDREK